jgi:hypothetical protein
MRLVGRRLSMANNRLYLYDPESNEAFMLAKSSGEGWSIWSRHELDDVMGRLERWFALRDYQASYRNCVNGLTTLQLMTDGDLPADAVLDHAIHEEIP